MQGGYDPPPIRIDSAEGERQQPSRSREKGRKGEIGGGEGEGRKYLALDNHVKPISQISFPDDHLFSLAQRGRESVSCDSI